MANLNLGCALKSALPSLSASKALAPEIMQTLAKREHALFPWRPCSISIIQRLGKIRVVAFAGFFPRLD
jgi:hypothetical protein